jgi:hypothetical protein
LGCSLLAAFGFFRLWFWWFGFGLGQERSPGNLVSRLDIVKIQKAEITTE